LRQWSPDGGLGEKAPFDGFGNGVTRLQIGKFAAFAIKNGIFA